MLNEKIIGAYTNGNYKVIMGSEGTKIRYNDANYFAPEFPESIDCKISNRCDKGCAFCHEGSSITGDLANLNHPIFDSLPKFSELAVGGGNVLEHPDLVPFLERMRERGVICNITLHLDHFENAATKVRYWQNSGLVHGVGISVNQVPTDYQLDLLRMNPNIVVHVIAGIVPLDALSKMMDCGLKLLILGYKDYGRGHNYGELHPEIQARIAQLEGLLGSLKKSFRLISFDNLALKQLHIQSQIPEDEWQTAYMGEDGQFTMYLDMVKEEYAVSSTSAREPIFSNDIKELFKRVRNE